MKELLKYAANKLDANDAAKVLSNSGLQFVGKDGAVISVRDGQFVDANGSVVSLAVGDVTSVSLSDDPKDHIPDINQQSKNASAAFNAEAELKNQILKDPERVNEPSSQVL